MKADVIEEITRIYGYDNFEIHTASAPIAPVRPDLQKSVEDKVKDILVKRYSLHELHSYVWQYFDEYKALGIEVEDNIKLIGAVNPNIETIRKSIVPTQLCQVKYNTGFASDFGVFEIGRVIDGVDENNLCVEEKKLAITLFSKTKSVETLYFELRDMLAVISDDIKHKALSFEKKEATKSYQHLRNLNTIICDGKAVGEIGIVHPTISKKIDKKASVVYAELDFKAFAYIDNASIKYEEPGRFPGMEIDLSFVSNTFAPIKEAIDAQNCELVKGVSVVDVYSDESGKSITVRIAFAHPERTLTGDEVKAVTDKVIADLSDKGIALKM
jgi:phenylalanyl-tRNA synthetase beta chain